MISGRERRGASPPLGRFGGSGGCVLLGRARTSSLASVPKALGLRTRAHPNLDRPGTKPKNAGINGRLRHGTATHLILYIWSILHT